MKTADELIRLICKRQKNTTLTKKKYSINTFSNNTNSFFDNSNLRKHRPAPHASTERKITHWPFSQNCYLSPQIICQKKNT